MGFTRNYDMFRLLDMGVDNDLKDVSKTINFNGWFFKNTSGTIYYNVSRKGYSYTRYETCDSTAPLFWWSSNTPSYTGHVKSNIVVGTCGDEESYEDYKINTFSCQEYLPNSNINQTNGSTTYDKINFTINRHIYTSFLNTSGTTQTIKEVGIMHCGDFLIYRKVLDTPLVVPPDGYFKVSFDYSVPVPEILITQSNE